MGPGPVFFFFFLDAATSGWAPAALRGERFFVKENKQASVLPYHSSFKSILETEESVPNTYLILKYFQIYNQVSRRVRTSPVSFYSGSPVIIIFVCLSCYPPLSEAYFFS